MARKVFKSYGIIGRYSKIYSQKNIQRPISIMTSCWSQFITMCFSATQSAITLLLVRSIKRQVQKDAENPKKMILISGIGINYNNVIFYKVWVGLISCMITTITTAIGSTGGIGQQVKGIGQQVKGIGQQVKGIAHLYCRTSHHLPA